MVNVAFDPIHRDGVGGNEKIEVGFGRRALLSFKETPRGSNVTFECSRSGPCVACLYSEKVSISLFYFCLNFNRDKLNTGACCSR